MLFCVSLHYTSLHRIMPMRTDYILSIPQAMKSISATPITDEMMKKIAHEVYVRDNSFLGIPFVCVYIPGVSPVMRENILYRCVMPRALSCRS